MRADTHLLRRLAAVALPVLLALAGCKNTSKEATGTGVGRTKDPLVAGPNLIPKQNVPVPERGIGTKRKNDPLLGSPTGRGEKVGFTDDPERFKGTYVPSKSSTPASLAGFKDGEELKIESPGVKLVPAGGTEPVAIPVSAEGVEPLYTQLQRYGVKEEDRSLAREGARWVFRASVPISGNGARRGYVGEAATPAAAVKQVVDQIASDRK